MLPRNQPYRDSTVDYEASASAATPALDQGTKRLGYRRHPLTRTAAKP